MKKILKILGVIMALCLVLIITLPFMVNVDQFRPELVRAVNERIEGRFELGKLSLSLWGRIHIAVDGLKLSDSKGAPLVSVKDAAFEMPYTSVISGSPLITFFMKDPEIQIIKNRSGKLNFLEVVSVGKPGATEAPKDDAKTAMMAGIALPAIVLNARLGLSIENAKLVYRDEGLALTNAVEHLNFRIRDLSLSRKTEAELWADLNTRMGDDLVVGGPLRMRLELTPDATGGGFRGAAIAGEFSADDLKIEKGQLFVKRKGIPAHFKFDSNLTQDALTLKSARLVFHNAEISMAGSHHFEKGADLRFESKPVDLKPWSELIPMLREYELEGRLTLSGQVKGKPEALSYSAHAGWDGVSAKGPNLKAKPVLKGSIDVVTDRVEKLLLTMTAPGNSLQIEAQVASFTKPRVTFSVQSNGMDLDQWIDFPKPQKQKESTAQTQKPQGDTTAAVSAQSPGTSAADYDALLAPLRKNPVAQATVLDGSFGIAFIQAKGIRLEGLSGKVQMKNLVASLGALKMKVFEGAVAGSFSTDLKPAQPSYSMSVSVSGLDMQRAVESQFESFKNTLTGKLTANFTGSGKSFNPTPAKQNLQAKGDFKVTGGAFKSMDIAKMANDAIAGSIGKISDKVPLLKGRELKLSSSAGSKYDLISGSFTIKHGVLEAPDFAAKAAPKGGIDLRGYTRMGLMDESLDARWELTDAQRVTGADRLSVDIGGKTIHNFLAKSEADPVILPITVGCKWSAPCMSYTQVPEYLAGIAANRLTGAAKEAAKDAVKQKVQEQMKDVLKKNVGEALKGLFGR